ncbi:hypothetical protein NW761_013775 [Fusarium oxysporum]|uniref:FAD-binding domain-containing protein n=1 Tax=Fusarium oxysporum f. sp. pisi HDV247 TaxID=1080344 RepID=W9NGL8_FUSOX|nr:hypothetical protein FOVG_16874 [Fusarium oxysporum f. sp. pisi HDV247]KAJ4029626.1 hypothetical protein NW758_013512 [Fusarium oxysporum]KAJ4074559.1 hypothetical protein NW761_013775 [Fusarium oxysporum]
MFKIAIIGGGLGGLFAALSIHQHLTSENIQVDVYEQAPEYKEIGAGVGIGPNAAALVVKLGLREKLAKITGTRAGIWLSFRRFDDGSDVHTVKIPGDANTPHFSLHRAEFLQVLIDTVKERAAATLHTNKQCKSLEDQGETVLLTFADGTTTSVNLVIGADGIHSATRKHYVRDTPQYGNMVVYRGLCKTEDIADEWPLDTYATIFMAPGKHFLTFPISSDKVVNVVAFVTTPWEDLGEVKESWTLTSDRSAVANHFKDFAPAVQHVIQKMSTNPLKWVLFDRQPSPEWVFSGGKVVLLGDSAHAMCPHQGAGAGQALEDGYVLGRALHDYFKNLESTKPRPIADYLHLYQSVRYPRAEKVQETSRQAGDLYEFRSQEVKGLSYEDTLPVVRDLLKDRMKWIWTEDIDQVYEKALNTL